MKFRMKPALRVVPAAQVQLSLAMDGAALAGRVPAVGGLNLETAGVAFDADTGIHVDDFLRTTNHRIYAAGDVCLEHKYTDSAHASARIVVQNALFLGRRKVSALTIPWCTYTDPEIVHVGIYVKQARERGMPVKTFTVPMHDKDRAVADGEGGRLRQDPRPRGHRQDPRRHNRRAARRRNGRRHRPANGRARDSHVSDAGRSVPASRHCLHALAADALRRLGTAQMGRSLSALGGARWKTPAAYH